MRIPDKNYDVVEPNMMHRLIKWYKPTAIMYQGEKWDCDDIARDFWNYTKREINSLQGKNGIVGMIDFPDHTQIVYVQEKYIENMEDSVYYIDQRDWSIYKPNRKPKRIIM